MENRYDMPRAERCDDAKVTFVFFVSVYKAKPLRARERAYDQNDNP